MKITATILFCIMLTWSCSDLKRNTENSEELNALRTELDSLKNLVAKAPKASESQITTFLTFQKEDAEEAMNFYVGLFENSEVVDIIRWEKEGGGKEGTVMLGTFNLNGKPFLCSDSPPIHDWNFTPAVSNYVECKDEIELERLFAKLSENGEVMMPLNNYGFSQRFGFVEDRFGVSWQLNLN